MTTRTAAGASAAHEVQFARLKIEAFERQLAEERRRVVTFSLASAAERRVASALAAMSVWGWHLLADRQWPGTRGANIDLIHIGPGGVLVIDVKSWKEPRVECGLLYNGDADESDAVDKLLRITALVEEAVQELGLTPLEVVPVMVFTGRPALSLTLGRVHLLDERSVVPWANRRGTRLTDDQVGPRGGARGRQLPGVRGIARRPGVGRDSGSRRSPRRQ